MICPFCGDTIRDDAVFCTSCGSKIESSSSAQEAGEKTEDRREIVWVLREHMSRVEKTIQDTLDENARLKEELAMKEKELAEAKAALESAMAQIKADRDKADEAQDEEPIELEDEEDSESIEEPTQEQLIGAYQDEVDKEEEQELPPLQTEKTCPSCGAKMPQGNSFCTSCGSKLDQ